MYKTACLLTAAIVTFLYPGESPAAEQDARKIIRRVKAATAFVKTNQGFLATAFCIDSSGWYVTGRNALGRVDEGDETTLVLNPGETNEKVIRAKILRLGQANHLALLKAPGADFPYLPLGEHDRLFETEQVIVFGYPSRRIRGDDNAFPSVTVTARRITALHKSEGRLVSIQLDELLDAGNVGGPVVDAEGRVIGVVKSRARGSELNLAAPVSALKQFIERPVIEFEIAIMDEADSYKLQTLPIKIVSLKPPPSNRQVELEIQLGKNKPQRLKARGGTDGAYEFQVVLDPNGPAPNLLRVDAEFAEGSVNCRVADVEVSVGKDKIRLSEIHRIEPGHDDKMPKVILDGKVLRGPVIGLKKAKADFGNVTAKLDLAKAIRMIITPIERPPPNVSYRVLVRDGEKISGEQTGSIVIRRSPQDIRKVQQPNKIAPISPPQLHDDPKVVKLPGPIDDVVVGAGGRLLILHLKKLQQLAVFDISQAKIIKYLPLSSNDIAFAAGAHKLFIGLRGDRVIQRWDLKTLERELTVDAPEGGIGSMAIGSEAITPLIVLASKEAKRSYLIDTASMKAEPLNWQGWKGGAWGPVHLHVSFDGSTAVACGGGWAGIEVATIFNGRVTSSKAGSYVNGDTLVAGNGALVFPTKGGILRRDLASNVKGIEGLPFPAGSPAYSLAYFAPDNKPSLTLFGNNDPKRIATLRDVPELAVKSSLAIHQRVHLIPRAQVLITVGEGNDRLILRPFDLAQVLEEEGIDYLFVESAPIRRAKRGKHYHYPIRVRSQSGGVSYSLQSTPEGMSVSKEGVLTWNVPDKFEGRDVPVIVQVRDKSGQETFHSFQLTIE